MKTSQDNFTPTPQEMTALFTRLKQAFSLETVPPERKASLCALVARYGYLPWSHQQALEELSAAETLVALEEKLRLNGIYPQGEFTFTAQTLSPVSRAGYTDSAWIKKEGHEIKLLNLAGLGDGNASTDPGRLGDWLKQLVILPSGNPSRGILATTLYLLPFNTRDFGCAYIPRSSEVSPALEDAFIKQKLGLDAQGQLRFFLALAQLAGHPLLYDVLPQTGRFSTLVLSNPSLVRWFDIPALIASLAEAAEAIAREAGLAESVSAALLAELNGREAAASALSGEIPAHVRQRWLEKKQECSARLMTRETQEAIAHKVKRTVCDMLFGVERDPAEALTEGDVLVKQDEITTRLIDQGLWPAPGGAWCSYGTPVFDKLALNSNTPEFLHFDKAGRDVTAMANLDCLSPYYFVYFDRRAYNDGVIAAWIDYLKNLRAAYNFDGYRFDHVDHVVDDVSLGDGFPMSYRVSARVLGMVNAELQKALSHYASLAEYMLWDNLLEPYHQEMHFDLLWGNDMISQYQKNIVRIQEDNRQLETYNAGAPGNSPLSILRTYNNQDGEFGPINQYPAQLGERGALFKWFKLNFTPGGGQAARPLLYVDGDESFTAHGVQYAISVEASVPRQRNDEFHRQFDALRRLARELLTDDSYFQIRHTDPSGLASWLVSAFSKPTWWVVAHEKAHTECVIGEQQEMLYVERGPLYDIHLPAPDGFRPVSEWVLEAGALEFTERTVIPNLWDNWIHFDVLQPAEFHLYRLEAT